MANTFGRIGREDAQDGAMCLPSMYTVNKREQEWYVAGFNSVAQPLHVMAVGRWAAGDDAPVIEAEPELYYPTDEEYAEEWAYDNAPGYSEAQPSI